MKQRFLHFKQCKYLKEAGHFQTLAKMQSPKTLGYAPLISLDFNLGKPSWFEMLQTLSLRSRMVQQTRMLPLSLL
uniref:Carbonic anhydrase n=1 Tax=Rhizophora mucronata TaxID=61149 RepID=A0A2P2L6S1_RHIMU